MEPKKKPIPNPLPRASVVRGLVAVTSSRALPTVAALLAATSLLACSGESSDIAADQQSMRATLHGQPVAVAVEPQPGMGALEVSADIPNPRPVPSSTAIKPTPIPTPPAGGMKPIAPLPKTPKLAGKIAPIHTKTI